MELYEVLNEFCRRNSTVVSSSDKKKYSFMLKRLFSAQYPIQCNLVNNLESDPEISANLVALLATRYTSMPYFLKLKISQKKKKDSIFSEYEDCVLHKYMEINEIGIRELQEAYEINKELVDESLKLIKNNFFPKKESVIIKKKKSVDKKEDPKLF